MKGDSCLQPKNSIQFQVPVGEPSGGESRLAGASPASGILDGVPDDIRRVLPDEVVDQLLAGASTEEEIVGPGGLLAQLTKRLVERAMEVELTDHLGYEPHREPAVRAIRATAGHRRR